MRQQIKTLIGIIIRPKQTLLELPSDKFYILAFFISSYFAYARMVRKGFFQKMAEATGSTIFVVSIFIALTIIGFLVGALILKGIVRLCGKKFTLKKVMNILGYTQTPRLIFALPVSLMFIFMPARVKLSFMLGEYKIASIALAVIGGILLLYTIFLLIWGLIICPDIRKEKVLSEDKET